MTMEAHNTPSRSVETALLWSLARCYRPFSQSSEVTGGAGQFHYRERSKFPKLPGA
jgi:hypothetical protein